MPRLEAAARTRRGGSLDLAMVAMSRDAMLRSSEIPRVTWGDIHYLPDGRAYLEVQGEDVTDVCRRPLSPETMRALARLLPSDEDPAPQDRVFPLTTSQINRRVRSLCQGADMPGEYAASSPRIGQAEDLAEAGWTVEEITAYGRWKGLDAAWSYVQRSRHYGRLRSLQTSRVA